MNCRICKWAYLRVEKTKDWNYEACALGMLPMTPYLNGSCGLFETASDQRIAETKKHERTSTIIYGEAIDYELR